jgi:phosphocarrier protein HPr
MIEQTLTIKNKLGVHARASMKIIDLASRFQSDIKIQYKTQAVNAKDILEVMALAVSQGQTITLTTTGPDEQAAYNAIANLINRLFDEKE